MSPRYVSMIRTARLLTLVVAPLVFADPALAQWVPRYSIQRIGLFDELHTFDTGQQFSRVIFASNAGFVCGESDRSAGGGVDIWAWNGVTTSEIGLDGPEYRTAAGRRGNRIVAQNDSGQVAGDAFAILPDTQQSAGRDSWVWNGMTTQKVGLYDAAHKNSTGFRENAVVVQTRTGFVAGTATRYSAASAMPVGKSSWIWNGSESRRVGLIGGVYEGPNGEANCTVAKINDAGQAIGSSFLYSSNPALAPSDLWFWNGNAAQVIGLTGTVYEGTGGIRRGDPLFLNNAGQAAGTTSRYAGGSSLRGWDAWVFDGGHTIPIGLSGPGYFATSGQARIEPLYQNEQGQIAGRSFRYLLAGDSRGEDTWIWKNNQTIQVGFYGSPFTSSNATRVSRIVDQNAAGSVIGYSFRYSGINTESGSHAWIWNGSETVRIGLTGGQFTGSTGYEYSIPKLQNASGGVVGLSYQVLGTNTLFGNQAWVYDGTISHPVVSNNPVHTGSTGYQYMDPKLVNNSLQAVGYIERISGVDTRIGQDVWYFDPVTNLTHTVIPSVRLADNFAQSEIRALTQDGFLLGMYQRFEGGTGGDEMRAFMFRPDMGFADLESLVSGGIATEGWKRLLDVTNGVPTANLMLMDSIQSIVGLGEVFSTYPNDPVTRAVYVLVPSPSGVGVLWLSILMSNLVPRRRRCASFAS